MKFVNLNYENSRALRNITDSYTKINETGHYLLGPFLNSFETKFAIDQETKHCVAVKNATDALAIVFKLLNCQERTVIVPQFGAYPTVMAALQAGSKQIIAAPVDETYCIDLSNIDVPKNSVIVPVNLFGNESNLELLDQIADSKNCSIVEDCAQSTGIPRKKHKNVVASVHSFYPTKPLGSRGDGGAILTDNEDLAAAARKARFYGLNDGVIDSWGFNSRMDEWQSAFLMEKISYYRNMNNARRENARVFNQILEDNVATQTTNSVFHQYVILLRDRDKSQKKLFDLEIPSMIHYPKLISDMPYVKERISSTSCKRVNDHILSIPVGPHLKLSDIEAITSGLKEIRSETIKFSDIK